MIWICFLCPVSLSAIPGGSIHGDEAQRAQRCAQVPNEVLSVPEKDIPDMLLAMARGIAVIPHVIKGACSIGGSCGKGLVAVLNVDDSANHAVCGPEVTTHDLLVSQSVSGRTAEFSPS
jgi:lipid-binding SYLF domain-containing protein